ncbi:MAG: NAD(P)-dependent oxidoreductase [Acidobacteriota bacterium]
MTTIAFLGLGAMGSRMAANLVSAGHEVTVWNRTMERTEALRDLGAAVATSPRAAVTGAEVVISMVRDDVASRHVWLDAEEGAVGALGEDTIAIESSTLTVAWVKELAAALPCPLLDAPVAGSRPQAEAGTLAYVVGGDGTEFERVRPILEVMGGAIHHVGPVGQGMAMKLVVNAFFGIQVAAMGELVGLARAAGVEAQRTVDVLSALPVTSPALAMVGGAIAADHFAPMFPIDLVEKDLGYVAATATTLDADVPTSMAVRDVYRRAQEADLGGDNIAGVAQLFLRPVTA